MTPGPEYPILRCKPPFFFTLRAGSYTSSIKQHCLLQSKSAVGYTYSDKVTLIDSQRWDSVEGWCTKGDYNYWCTSVGLEGSLSVMCCRCSESLAGDAASSVFLGFTGYSSWLHVCIFSFFGTIAIDSVLTGFLDYSSWLHICFFFELDLLRA